MQYQRVVTLTSEQYAHLPSATHKLVVDALVERGEWKVTKPVKRG